MTRDETIQKQYRRAFWVFLGALTLFRLLVMGRFGLGTDEAHYYLYGQHLAWGYFDHPPMVGFLAAASARLGESPFWLRLGAAACWVVSLVLMRALALALYHDERVAFWGSVVLFGAPLLHLMAVALLPDATLNLFWCATLLAAWSAIRDGRWRDWLLTGLFFGGALLSKYHAILLPACITCFLLFSPKYRRWLWTPRPYVAVALGFLVFAPNIIWNYQHDWLSYAFQLAHGGGRGFRVTKLLENVAGQLGAASPVLFGLLVAAWVALLRSRPMREEDRFALCTSLPVFAFFCVVGLKGKLLPHWTAVGWWTGAMVLAVVVMDRWPRATPAGRRWRRWTVFGAALGGLMVTGLYIALLVPVIGPLYTNLRKASLWVHERAPLVPAMEPYRSKFDVANELYGWDEVGEKVEALRARMPDPAHTFIFCHRFFTTSILYPHLREGTVATSLHHKPSQYQLWFDPAAHRGWDAIFVDEDRFRQDRARYVSLFDSIDDEPETFEVMRGAWVARSVRMYRCYQFKGELNKP